MFSMLLSFCISIKGLRFEITNLVRLILARQDMTIPKQVETRPVQSCFKKSLINKDQPKKIKSNSRNNKTFLGIFFLIKSRLINLKDV